MMMSAFHNSRLLAVFIVILSYDCSTMSCLESERQALLMLKGGFVDEFNNLGSWVDVGGGNCCDWYGVSCNSSTGHVIGLHLQGTSLRGVISSAIGNLTSLVTLTLESNSISGSIPLSFGELQSLKEVHIGENLMTGVISEAHFKKLTNLKSFRVYSNMEMKTSPSWVPPFQLTHLSLSSWKLGKHLPDWLQTQKDMKVLDLSGCGIETIPSWFWNLSCPLGMIFLSENNISSEIPRMAGQNLMDGVMIYLDSNKLTGQVPILSSKVQYLDLSNNLYEYISKEFWNSTSSLIDILLANNRIVGEIPSMAGENFMDGVSIFLGSNKLTGQVPVFSSKVRQLDLSNNSFDSVSKGFWNSTTLLLYLVLANNRIVGEIPSIEIGGEGVLVDLSSNYFTGQVPSFSSSLIALDLSNNSFFGSISHFLCHETKESKQLEILNLGDNLLSGEIPDCWNAWKNLRALKLNNNNFTGGLPSSMQNLSLLESLHVRNNSLGGELNLLLRNTQKLVVVDLAENQLEGEIPAWIGESNLTILDLRSNKFHGKIPQEICSLASLQILDLAANNLIGNIPHCINKLQSLVISGKVKNVLGDQNSCQAGGDYAEDAVVVMKGRVMEYGNTLNLVRLIDLSGNSLSGDVPPGVTTLVALQSLNLSHNFLTGAFPQQIGAMKEIESLDLSMNKLSGEIPESITNLTFLSNLNLSSNNLKGAIPLSTQLQGFNASCFSGNDLCGPPLAKSCTPITGNATDSATEDGHPGHVKWSWVSAAFGFVLGFWVVVFPVFYSRRWRLRFFGVLDRIWAFLLVIFGRYHHF